MDTAALAYYWRVRLPSECVGENRTAADETTSIDDAAVRVNRRYRMASVQGDDLGAGARTIMRLSQSSAHRCPVSVARPADPSSTRRCKSRRSSTSGLRRSVMAPARTSSFSSISISTSRPRATSPRPCAGAAPADVGRDRQLRSARDRPGAGLVLLSDNSSSRE